MIFTTPVAWIMMMVFTVLCALFFTDVFSRYVEAQAAGSHLSFVTSGMFSSDSMGLFPTVQFYLFLFIPLVSMGMISRDLSTGSIKLLYSSNLMLDRNYVTVQMSCANSNSLFWTMQENMHPVQKGSRCFYKALLTAL